jgi:hypothetical protein
MRFPAARLRRLSSLTAAALAASCSLAACSGDDGSTGGGDDGGKGIANQPVISPLTGLRLKGKAPRHPVLTVKVDNTDNSAPQVGLGAADMMVEELVEGGITRLALFFYEHTPKRVGPVRSMRATDIGVVQPLGGVLVASGGAPPTVKRIKDAGIPTFTESDKGFSRDTGRSAPYNLFVDLAQLAATVKAKESPHPYLPFGDGKLPKGQPAKGLTARFSPSSSTTFAFQDGHYVNTDSRAAEGDRFLPSNVVVLRVQVGDAGYLDPAGNHVPETKFTGTGPAMVFHDGRLVRGTWVKDGFDADVQLKSAGHALQLPPGRTWIELVPADGGDVTVTR